MTYTLAEVERGLGALVEELGRDTRYETPADGSPRYVLDGCAHCLIALLLTRVYGWSILDLRMVEKTRPAGGYPEHLGERLASRAERLWSRFSPDARDYLDRVQWWQDDEMPWGEVLALAAEGYPPIAQLFRPPLADAA